MLRSLLSVMREVQLDLATLAATADHTKAWADLASLKTTGIRARPHTRHRRCRRAPSCVAAGQENVTANASPSLRAHGPPGGDRRRRAVTRGGAGHRRSGVRAERRPGQTQRRLVVTVRFRDMP